MRIGILCHASFGGSARVATELAIGLAQRGHQVHLFTRTLPFGQWEARNGVCVHTAVPEWDNNTHPSKLIVDWSDAELQTFALHVSQIFAHEKLEVLHFHYAVPFAKAAFKVRRYLEPLTPILVGTLHGTDVSIHGRSQKVGPHLSHLLRRVDALTTVSHNYAQLSKQVFQLPGLPRVIPNFVDLQRFHPQKRSHLASRGRGKPRLVHISNFRPVKDTKNMARIFVEIHKQIEAELWLIGDGPEMEAVKNIFRDGSVEDDVRFWGLLQQKDVAPLLAKTDLLLMTSLNESFSLVALEAMSCGVPVVSTDVGGLPEVVLHAKTGYLYPQGDLTTARKRALQLLTNPIQHQEMRRAALRHARKFDRQEIIPHYEALYRELLQQRSSISLSPYRQERIPLAGLGSLSK